MRVVLCTAPPEVAGEIAKTVVTERLAACVNIVPAVRSVYVWKGELCDDTEALLIVKTRAARLAELTARLVSIHPYDVPEVIALPIGTEEGNPTYLAWLSEQTSDET